MSDQYDDMCRTPFEAQKKNDTIEGVIIFGQSWQALDFDCYK